MNEIVLSNNMELKEIRTDKKILIRLLIDKSSPMSDYTNEVEKGLQLFKSSIANSKEAPEILVGKTLFNTKKEIEGYKPIDDFSTNYTAEGGTALFDAIIQTQQDLTNENKTGYMDQLLRGGIRAPSIVVIFSAGIDQCSYHNLENARNSIEFLKQREVCVSFLAFGTIELSNIANQLGIPSKNIALTRILKDSSIRNIFKIISQSVITTCKNPYRVYQDSFFDLRISYL